MDFCKSNTYLNVQKSLLGELEASSKYNIFSDIAREDGYEQIGNVFELTSKNEREHAEIMMKLIGFGNMPSTKENLHRAIKGEQREWNETYIEFAKVANNEGFFGIAKLFYRLAEVEKGHDARFSELLCNMEKDAIFCKDSTNLWQCMNCGYIVKGRCAPHHCPLCGYPVGYFEIKCDNY